jgi:hypothetical protein
MKMLILGKILVLFLILNTSILASVNAVLSTNEASRGEVVVLQLRAYGEAIEFPEINDINGEPIIGTSRSSQVQIVNQKYNKDETLSFQFVAKKSMVIDPFVIKVDGDVYKTPSLALKVVKPSASKKGDDFQLKLTVDKDEVYVGEPIKLTIQFLYKKNKQVRDIDFEAFNQQGLWVKTLANKPQYEKDGFNILEQDYIIFVQDKEFKSIDQQVIKVAARDLLRNYTKWHTIFSNELEIKVKPLPNGLDILGDFSIEASVDKMEVDQNKPINFTLKIKGFGNIDDIDSFDLDQPRQTVYSSTPELNTYIKQEQYGGEFVQKFSIIANESFSIKPIKFTYFDKNTKKMKTITTKAIDIKVNQTQVNTPSQIQTKKDSDILKDVQKLQENSTTKYIYAFIGIILGSLITFILLKNKNTRRKQDRPIDIQIKKARGDKELYEVLLPFVQDPFIDDIMKKLEENMYKNTKNKINKKEILEKIKQ